MKALVTGSTGFIGSHLVEALLERGYEVRCTVRNTSKTHWIHGKPVEIRECRLDDRPALLDALRSVDIVFHIAGVTAARNREEFFRGNQIATRNVAQAAVEAGTVRRLVHLSSLAAVGPSADGTPVTETSPYRPITAYGESKRAAEQEVLRVADRLAVTIVRPPAVYGPRDWGVYSFFQTVHMGIVPLIGFDRKLVSLVQVRDLVRGIIMAAESERAEGETFFVADEMFYDWRQVGELTKRVMQRRAITARIPHTLVYAVSGVSQFLGRFREKPPIFDREKGTDITQRFWICSTDKARDLLGYRQQVDLETGVRETVSWYEEHGWL